MKYWFSLLSLANLALYIVFIPPVSTLNIVLLFVIIFTCFFSLSFLLFRRPKYNLFISTLPVILLLFIFFNQLNPLNVVIVITLYIAIYFLIK